MNPGYELKTNNEDEKKPEIDNINYPSQQPLNKTSMPMIAGILLIISGATALIFSIPLITIDISMIESTGILAQFQTVDPSITAENIRGLISICGTITAFLSVFPILGGILSFKRKFWGVALGCSILGLSTFIVIIPGIFSLIGLILIAISKKDFQ
jgi:hypothetical protein